MIHYTLHWIQWKSPHAPRAVRPLYKATSLSHSLTHSLTLPSLNMYSLSLFPSLCLSLSLSLSVSFSFCNTLSLCEQKKNTKSLPLSFSLSLYLFPSLKVHSALFACFLCPPSSAIQLVPRKSFKDSCHEGRLILLKRGNVFNWNAQRMAHSGTSSPLSSHLSTCNLN